MKVAMNYLKIAAEGTLYSIVAQDTWRDLCLGLLAVMVLALRFAILLTFPISTPLIAWLIWWLSDRKFKRDAAATTERLLRDMHRNGRS